MSICRWSLLIMVAAMVTGCGTGAEKGRSPQPTGAASGALFTDRARESGLDFSYWNGMTGRYYLLEVMGGGAALFDYDDDGDLDVYLVQGAALDDGREPLSPPPAAPGDRLFRNDLAITPAGDRELRFTDVTAEAGIAGFGYGMGVAAGDVDNDGRVDLYVTRWGANQLLRNNGADAEGRVTFTDVTRKTGAGDERWSVAATFFDFDRDGWLDLYVGNYVDFSLGGHKVCVGFGAGEDYCGPSAYQPQPDKLLRNLGPGADGLVTFADVTAEAGLDRAVGPGLGAVAADFDGDGWPDLYVANDQAENHLWISQGLGIQQGAAEGGTVRFTDRALLAGCAVSAGGKVEASMGVDAADYDGDGDPDLFLTHLTGESHTLYVNDGRGGFDDATIGAGLDAASWSVTGFGAAWLDVDGDGRLDLMTVNGAVHRIEAQQRRGEPYPLGQPNQLFRNPGQGAFVEISAAAGAAFGLAEVSRGLAVGDVDNDGDVDALVVHSNGPARLLINESPGDRHWLGVRLIGRDPGRDMPGARAALHRPGQPPLWRRVHTDGSYASARDPRLLFGLGESPRIGRLEVHWPDGGVEVWAELAADRYVTLRQGSGQRLERR